MAQATEVNVNLSGAVRDHLLEVGIDSEAAKPKAVIAALAAKGIAVTGGLVSNVKTNLRNNKGPTKPSKKKATATTTSAPKKTAAPKKAPTNGEVTLADAVRLHDLVKELGGTNRVREILEKIDGFSN